MSKYAALGDYLSRQNVGHVQMSFSEIEQITGGKLPVSQRYPAWWSNNPQNNPMTRVWLDAGFQTEQVDITARKLVFRRTSTDVAASRNVAAKEKNGGEHPLIGCMQGTVFVPDGVDLTAPADPDWADIADAATIDGKA